MTTNYSVVGCNSSRPCLALGLVLVHDVNVVSTFKVNGFKTHNLCYNYVWTNIFFLSFLSTGKQTNIKHFSNNWNDMYVIREKKKIK